MKEITLTREQFDKYVNEVIEVSSKATADKSPITDLMVGLTVATTCAHLKSLIFGSVPSDEEDEEADGEVLDIISTNDGVKIAVCGPKDSEIPDGMQKAINALIEGFGGIKEQA